MTLEGTQVLVTGGAGFIGSHLVDRLVAEGARVRILDDLSTGDEENINQRAEFILGDIRDKTIAEQAMRGVELVFHSAAQINPARAVEDPYFDFEVNAQGTLVLLLAAAEAGVKKFIMASTNLYGDAEAELMREDFAVLYEQRSLLSPYAAAKAAAEAYLKVFNDEIGLPTVRLRYTNVYGPRQLTKSESGVVAIFVRSALRGKPLVIFGDGLQTRDFVYVDDVVEANVLAALRPEANGKAFNIGTGVQTSVRELAAMIKELVGSASAIEYGPPRAADFRRVCVDISLAERTLGWRPRTALREGLAAYIAWCRANEHRLG